MGNGTTSCPHQGTAAPASRRSPLTWCSSVSLTARAAPLAGDLVLEASRRAAPRRASVAPLTADLVLELAAAAGAPAIVAARIAIARSSDAGGGNRVAREAAIGDDALAVVVRGAQADHAVASVVQRGKIRRRIPVDGRIVTSPHVARHDASEVVMVRAPQRADASAPLHPVRRAPRVARSHAAALATSSSRQQRPRQRAGGDAGPHRGDRGAGALGAQAAARPRAARQEVARAHGRLCAAAAATAPPRPGRRAVGAAGVRDDPAGARTPGRLGRSASPAAPDGAELPGVAMTGTPTTAPPR